MLGIGANSSTSSELESWTASAYLDAEAHEVLRSLTDPTAIAAWAPVRFEVDGLSGERLRTGACERVTGSLAGIRVAFDVEVQRADSEGLILVATGPITLDVAYRFRYTADRLVVEATVGLPRRGGLRSQVLRAAVAGLLNAGALAAALRRLEGTLSRSVDEELVTA